MNSEELENSGYKLIVEDSELEVRVDPQEAGGYALIGKDSGRFILFPRGTLEDLAKSNRDAGKSIIHNLANYDYFVEDTKLNCDSINAIATKAYLKEKENYEISRAQQKIEND